MSSQVIPERATFLQHLRQSRLVSEEQVRALESELAEADARDLARALIARQLLTRYQARQLLHGRPRGFFFGPYRILDLLGQGGMGKVYHARHENLGRDVALKVMAAKALGNPRARRLFQREAQAAARLDHANIVRAYDAGQVHGRHYLTMEYVEGINLRDLVRKCGPLPVGLACEIVRQAALGLQHAGDKGMVHRDIKPANLMLEVGDATVRAVKILDFGLARLNLPAEQSRDGAATIVSGRHTVMGTPDFVSPEQAKNLHGVDIRSDLYSLGCTFYFLLTGQPPFPGGSFLEKLIRHGTEQPAFVETLRPDVPMAVADIVHLLLAKDPADRFQTPSDLALALAPHADARAKLVKRKRQPTTGDETVAMPTATPGPNDTAPHACTVTFVAGEQTDTSITRTRTPLEWAGEMVSEFVEAALSLLRLK